MQCAFNSWTDLRRAHVGDDAVEGEASRTHLCGSEHERHPLLLPREASGLGRACSPLRASLLSVCHARAPGGRPPRACLVWICRALWLGKQARTRAPRNIFTRLDTDTHARARSLSTQTPRVISTITDALCCVWWCRRGVVARAGCRTHRIEAFGGRPMNDVSRLAVRPVRCSLRRRRRWRCHRSRSTR
jgi:hypothetical protein